MSSAAPNGKAFRVDRGYVEVSGPDAEDFLERMLSNEVATLEPGSSRPALLLTAKGRITAPVRAVRTAEDAFLLVTDSSDLAGPVAESLLASRFASKCEIETRPWVGFVQVGSEPAEPAVAIPDFGVEAWEAWREQAEDGADATELERLRIDAGTPAWGKELDEAVLPAEAGLDETHISFTKGCFPGQEPIARLHYRGHANRGLRVLEVDDAPEPETEIVYGGKAVGRVTSSVPGLALAYVRREVPADAELVVGGRRATQLH